MSIKTKKITDLNTIEAGSAAALEGLVFVAADSSGLTGKVKGSAFIDMVNGALQSSTSTIVESLKKESTDISNFEAELTQLKKTVSITAEKSADIQSRVSDLETKIKALNSAHAQLSVDTSNHILEVKGQVESIMGVFRSLASEEKLTLAKIQETVKTLFPDAQ